MLLAPDKLPPEPPPKLTFPVATTLPATLIPASVTTNTLAVPLTLVVTLPPAVAMSTLLFPFARVSVSIVPKDNTPEPFVFKY